LLEIIFQSSNDKLARLSAYLGEGLSSLTLLKAHSVILVDKSAADAGEVMARIHDFLAEEHHHDFDLMLEGEKVIMRAITNEAKSWASSQGQSVGLPPGLYQCLHCGKTFTSDEEYRAHIIIHYV
jgi:Zinc finger, C2H2 type